MSDAPEKDQKTELPTAKRRADASRDGDVLMSRELATAIMMLAGSAWMLLAGKWVVTAIGMMVSSGLTLRAGDLDHFAPGEKAVAIGQNILWPMASLFALTTIAALAVPLALGSLGWRSKAMKFKGSRINPGAGLKRMFGAHGAIELGKALAKVAVLSLVGYHVVTRALPITMGLAATDPQEAILYVGSTVGYAMLWLSVGLLAIALVDVPAQILQRNNRLKMSRKEVRDEMRDSEGTPEIKQAQRARQMEFLSNSARKAVAEATVILTNPSHFAVALRYRPGIDEAPMVTARGRDEIALAIKALGRDNNIPCLEYPPLTRAIYFTSRAGRTVSEDLYLAVATVLAFVFRLDTAIAQGLAQPVVDIPVDKRFDANGERETV